MRYNITMRKTFILLGLVGVAFGSNLCFDPYNFNYNLVGHDWNNNGKKIPFHINEVKNGKSYINGNKNKYVKVLSYVKKDNKVLVLMHYVSLYRYKGKLQQDANNYFLVQVNCINKKPVVAFHTSISDSINPVHIWHTSENHIKPFFYNGGVGMKGYMMFFDPSVLGGAMKPAYGYYKFPYNKSGMTFHIIKNYH